MNLRIRRYVVGDAALIRPRREMLGEINAIGLDILDCHVPEGDAWTVTRDGMPVACGGLWPIWRGRLCAWTWISDLSLREWVSVAETMTAQVNVALRLSARPLRIEATAKEPKARRFLGRLGFAFEGVMSGYGPDGSDYALYARTNRP